jgi:hypothetical protein
LDHYAKICPRRLFQVSEKIGNESIRDDQDVNTDFIWTTTCRWHERRKIPIDHYCFYEPSAKVLFSSDYDLSAFGPWYGHRESNIDSFKDSVELLKKLDIAVSAPSHGAIVTKDISA